MNEFHSIQADKFDVSPFRLIGREWALITAEKNGRVNTMTASWGGLGVMWNMNTAWMVIRDSRYTKTYIDAGSTFSVCFLDHGENADTLMYLGSASGRNEDKIAKAGLTVRREKGIPFFDEAKTVLLCRKLCCQPLDGTIPEITYRFYADGDLHNLYIAEILEILGR